MKDIVKCIVFTFVIFYSTSPCYAQDLEPLKYRASAMSSRFLSPDGTWSNWTDLVKINYLMVVDLDKQRVTIYAAKTVVYDFISEVEIRQYDDGGTGYIWKAVNDGTECIINLHQGKVGEKNHQLHVSQKYIQSIYHMQLN